MNSIQSFRMAARAACLALAVTVMAPAAWAQTLTDVVVPQYIQGFSTTNTNRTYFAYRVTLSGLTPNATYRYINQIVNTATDTATTAGAGNPIFIAADGTFTYTSTTGFVTAGQYGEFTTDGSGSYTGWFANEPTGNARFTPGNVLNARIRTNDGAGGTTVVNYLTTTDGFTVADFGDQPANGTALRCTSSYTAKNFVALYDNTAGTGRPIAVTFVESDGLTAASSVAAFYKADVDPVAGAFGVLIPNTLANGIRRIVQLSRTDGSQVGTAATDADGVWPSGASTVNPTGGTTTVIVLLSTDLGGGALPVLTVTGTPLGGFANAWPIPPATPETKTFSVSGTDLTGNITISAPPTGFETKLSSSSTWGSAAITITPVSGAVASTGVDVRFNPSTSGPFSGSLTVSTPGTTDQTVALSGSANDPASTLLYEPFDYVAGNNVIGSGSWINSGTQTGFDVLVESGSLQFPGLPQGQGGKVSVQGKNPAVDPGLDFMSISSGSVYASFLVRVVVTGSSADTSGAKLFNFRSNAGFAQGHLRIRYISDNEFKLGISLGKYDDATVAYIAQPLAKNQTYYVIFKHIIVDGANNDQLAMWINPTPGGATEGEGAIESVSYTWVSTGSGTDYDLGTGSLAGIRLEQESFCRDHLTSIDEIRVGTTYDSVNPYAPPPTTARLWTLYE